MKTPSRQKRRVYDMNTNFGWRLLFLLVAVSLAAFPAMAQRTLYDTGTPQFRG